MRLGKKAQYALLFVLYLARSGRANVHTAAANLNISPTFLEQVSRSLRMAGVINVKRGPGGGYELNGSPTVGEVLKAMGVGRLMTSAETEGYNTGGVEHRALNHIVGSVSVKLGEWFKTPITAAGAELVRNEVAQLNSADSARVN